MPRRLTAILIADVVGYSRLMGKDEVRTLAALAELRQKLFEPVVGARGGNIIKRMGDGWIVEFPNISDATTAAIEVQEGLLDHEVIRLRIGVHIGDVTFQDDDVYGDGVNVAARLEAKAEPGQVLISDTAYQSLDGKAAHNFGGGDLHELKNIARPVALWHWPAKGNANDTVATDVPGPVSGFDGLPAIAVLAFDNLSNDPDQEYFADGIVEDIITALSQWRSIPVIARNSTFTYKGKAVKIQTVAKELGVKYVLEGSVRKSGTRVRVNAQLIDAKTGHNVWAEKFDSHLKDIFDIQDELTERIAATIIPEVQSFENRRSARKRTEDLNAWDCYLRGTELFYLDTCEGIAAARDMFQSAVEKDTHYGDAWARLGWCYAKSVMQSCVKDTATTLEQGFVAAQRAVLLDDESALAHLALGTVHIWANETDKGTEEAVRAVDLNSNDVEALFAAGNRLDLVGRSEEGIDMICRALKLNPRDPARWRYMAYLSRACIAQSDPDSGLIWAKKAVLLKPELAEAQFRYAVALANVDQVDEARLSLEKCDAIVPGYVASKTAWKPYPDDVRNELVMNGLRRHMLLA